MHLQFIGSSFSGGLHTKPQKVGRVPPVQTENGGGVQVEPGGMKGSRGFNTHDSDKESYTKPIGQGRKFEVQEGASTTVQARGF